MNAPARTLHRRAALCLLAALAVALPLHAADRKSKILVILADDLGWADAGWHGSEIKTPNLDQLANGGAKLEQF